MKKLFSFVSGSVIAIAIAVSIVISVDIVIFDIVVIVVAALIFYLNFVFVCTSWQHARILLITSQGNRS